MSTTIDEEPLEELSEADGFPGERRRQITNLFVHAVLLLVMIATVAVLAWVLVYVAGQGLKYLGPEFLTQTPPGNPSQPGGGFLNGIIGSLIVTGIATLLSMPVGIAAAIYLVEYGGQLARVTRFLTDILVGVPTIVTGALVYAMWVVFFGFSGIAGGIALGLVMLPLVIRSTEEMLRLVPRELREASVRAGRHQGGHDHVCRTSQCQLRNHHRCHARICARHGRNSAAAADCARQRPVHRTQPDQTHVDAVIADLRQRHNGLQSRPSPCLGGSPHFGGVGPALYRGGAMDRQPDQRWSRTCHRTQSMTTLASEFTGAESERHQRRTA